MTSRSTNKQKDGKSRTGRRAIAYAALGLAVLCIAAAVTLFILYKDVNYRYYMELGSPIPSAEVFSRNGSTVEYSTGFMRIDASKTGDHWLHVSVNGSDRLVDLIIRDTVAPEAQPVDLAISIRDKVKPDRLVSGLSDAGPVKLLWQTEPPFGTAGDYSVVIDMCDMSGNTSSVTSTLHIKAVVDSIDYEAGSALPALADFLFDTALNGKFITDLSSLPLEKTGQYDVAIEVNGVPYTSMLIVKDTVRPELALHNMAYLRLGDQIKPEDFVSTATDATALSFKFASEPDCNTAGFQDVGVIATDLGGNTVEKQAKLFVSKVAPVTVEIRGTPLTSADFPEAPGVVTVPRQTVPDKLGELEVDLTLDGERAPALVTVVDTTKPTAEAMDVSGFLMHPLVPEKFVKNAFDYTKISYSFAADPDWSKTGAQSVTVKLTDAAGNNSEYISKLTLVQDAKAPSLFGVKDRYCYVGQAVAYFAEVYAVDNCDPDVRVDVDNSAVDINKKGSYKVTYSATDTSGNTVKKTCTFTFVEASVTDEDLNAAAQKVLSKIITDDMSIGQKAYAIFNYVNTHVKYTGTSNKKDWKYEAYRGITQGRGDCFTFFSTAKILLNMIGAETMDVERQGGTYTTHHYWLLVNLGTGWYHFDALKYAELDYKCFMRTDKEIRTRVGRNFYSFDHSLYPPTPDKPYVLK
jgi:hypothetical protein